ncbi:MAG: lysophospholipid acyltransferase family protein [Deltaproteobacteria bacterium]|jgi:1-acyl-sn-glycerol-3-phosphate acyltransferase|nr:lysophospholipid acyltransferase family protein [Deltaproteobacteria bacterium]
MKKEYLKNKTHIYDKLFSLLKGGGGSIFLVDTLFSLNFVQLLSLGIRPFSKPKFRKINSWTASKHWGLYVTLSKLLNQVEVLASGDRIPADENAIVFANHQEMTDIPVLLFLAKQKQRLGDLKWFAKYPIKYVPGVGWGLMFLDCLFVKRNWSQDKDFINNLFSKFKKEDIPLWLISFVEGTRITDEKLEISRKFARKKGFFLPENVMIPRTRGFAASVKGLREHVDAIYDITIGYPEGVPTLLQFIRGYAKKIHIHIRRFPLAQLPEDEEQLKQWLVNRFEEKDQLLHEYKLNGFFSKNTREV